MKTRKRKKGFTLVELLVVIGIIALLMGILMPALAQVRALALRMTCGSNLSGIGKALLAYTNDYDGEFPRAGSGATTVMRKACQDWLGGEYHLRTVAYGIDSDDIAQAATVTSSLYLLVKYIDVPAEVFVCPTDSGTSEFELSIVWHRLNAADVAGGLELADCFDFSRIFKKDEYFDRIFVGPDQFCSYPYQHPYNLYPLTTSSEPGLAVLADRNPWIQSPSLEELTADDWKDYTKVINNAKAAGDKEIEWNLLKKVNSYSHQQDGQNVLFLDIHVGFERTVICGVDDDNIYTRYNVDEDTGRPIEDVRLGVRTWPEYEDIPVPIDDKPGNRKDSYLISNELGKL